jgi:S-adenosylmethionine:tRNA ribosyltransferase-isomerase
VRVADFDFELPEELIAQHPPAVRGSSRMLAVDRATGLFEDGLFADLPSRLQPGDLLVLNDSRVLPARLFATRAGLRTQAGSAAPSGRIEVLLTQQTAPGVWSALVRPGRKVPVGETLHFAGHESNEPLLSAEVVAAGEFGERTLSFAPDTDFYEKLDRIGHMPLPPYIRRAPEADDTAEDCERYQTVYAQERGSAAAPTAGLHFTPEILAALEARGVEIARITLHVGLGTFQPVRVETLDEIRLHTEHYTLSAATAEAINRAVAQSRRIIAVGTTTTRTLEHCAAEAGSAPLAGHSGSTSIFLRPGHRFRLISGQLTNFHLPQSTLLMLVSALLALPADPDEGRRRALAAYAHAVSQRYRFFSYGDCMLIL